MTTTMLTTICISIILAQLAYIVSLRQTIERLRAMHSAAEAAAGQAARTDAELARLRRDYAVAIGLLDEEIASVVGQAWRAGLGGKRSRQP